MLLYAPFSGEKQEFKKRWEWLKERTMSEAFKRIQPVIEATIISVALVAAALAVPAAIMYVAV